MYTRVIDKGYWKEPLDLAIPITLGGQFFKYFHQHVRPLNSKTSEACFDQYTILPAELQVQVLQSCDAPTLFQIMRTSRNLRAEAKKLFFSDRNTWYRLSMRDLLIICSCPGESIYDVDFLASIEQLNLDCDTRFDDWVPDEACKGGITSKEFREMNFKQESARMKDLWQTVKRLCPQVKRILLSLDRATMRDDPPIYDCYQKLAQYGPRGVEILFYGVEKPEEAEAAGRRQQRVWWRLRAGNEDANMSITPKREDHLEALVPMVVPPQKVHRGHIRAFINMVALWTNYSALCFAAKVHRAAAVEKHHFEERHEPFGCSMTDCDAWFEEPDQYTTHLLATGHRDHEPAPEHFEALFAENAKRLEGLCRNAGKENSKFWDWWGEDTEQQGAAKKEIMNQLKNDALYAQDGPTEEHGLLRWILEAYFWKAYGDA